MANLTNEKAEFAIAIFRHFSPFFAIDPPRNVLKTYSLIQSRWNARRHEYTVHGIGTPLTSDDLASRQSGTECMECKKSPVDIPPNSTGIILLHALHGMSLDKSDIVEELKYISTLA